MEIPLQTSEYADALPVRLPAASGGDGASLVASFIRLLGSWISRVRVRPAKKRLRVCESVSLGEKRFVALIRVDDKEFLVGGAANSVSLMTQLGTTPVFAAALHSQVNEVKAQA